MKTNTIQLILAGLFTGIIAYVATSTKAVDFSFLATCVGYSVVASIAAVAAVDYRRNLKKYAAN